MRNFWRPRALTTLLIFFGLASSAFATLFLETTIEDRMNLATGVIKGKFLGQVYKKLPSGRVVTEATFKVEAFSGLRQHEIINHNNFKVTYPGGVWQNRVYKVHGTPTFKKNEDVVLMVKKGDFGYIVPDLALSKFSIIKREQKQFLQSEIFPEKLGVGLIEYKEFEALVERSFDGGLERLVIDKYVDKKGEGPENLARKPASGNNSNKANEEENIPVIWFVLGLGLLGFVSTLLMRGKGNEN